MRKVKFIMGLLSLSLFVAAPGGGAGAAPKKLRFGVDPEIAYLRALAGLRDGKKAEFIAGRNTLRAIAMSHESSRPRISIRASTIRSAQRDLLISELRHIKITRFPFGILHIPRKRRAWNFLSGLPPVYIRGFAYMRDDGTAVADPDPFIRLQLLRDRYPSRASGAAK